MKHECTTCKGNGMIESFQGDGHVYLIKCGVCDGFGYWEEYEHEDKHEKAVRR